MTKSQTLESMKLSKKQLLTTTEMIAHTVILTIGELTLDQLRVTLYRAQRERDRQEAVVYKILNICEGSI